MIEPSVPSLDDDGVVLTGRRRAGKDHVAETNGYVIYGFADPMYDLAEHFIGSSDKEKPGVLDFIYRIGAWGRGDVNEEYPLTPERKRITEDIRETATQFTSIGSATQWQSFGKYPSFWTQILENRIRQSDEDRIAVTNARFPNELRRMCKNAGLNHYHVMCAEETRMDRLGEEEYHGPSSDPEDLPVTEQMAAHFDRAARGCDVDTSDNSDLTVGDRRMYDLSRQMEAVQNRDTLVWNDDPTNKPASIREDVWTKTKTKITSGGSISSETVTLGSIKGGIRLDSDNSND
jgi:hypothetical protein